MRADRVIMTKQLQGEIRLAGWSGATDGDWAYTPWMPVRGDKATAGVEVLALEGGANLTWEAPTQTMESGSPVDLPRSSRRLGGGLRELPGVAAILAGEPVRCERRRLGGASWFSIEQSTERGVR
jgi:hypothetical protein